MLPTFASFLYYICIWKSIYKRKSAISFNTQLNRGVLRKCLNRFWKKVSSKKPEKKISESFIETEIFFHQERVIVCESVHWKFFFHSKNFAQEKEKLNCWKLSNWSKKIHKYRVNPTENPYTQRLKKNPKVNKSKEVISFPRTYAKKDETKDTAKWYRGAIEIEQLWTSPKKFTQQTQAIRFVRIELAGIDGKLLSRIELKKK